MGALHVGGISVESDETDDAVWPPPGTTRAAFIVRLPIVLPHPGQGGSPYGGNISNLSNGGGAGGAPAPLSCPFLATGRPAAGATGVEENTVLMSTGGSGGIIIPPSCVVYSAAPAAQQCTTTALHLPTCIRVLVVDDLPINRTLMRRMLQSRQVAPSWEVEDAENGARQRLIRECDCECKPGACE